jgi:hypothetical protein
MYHALTAYVIHLSCTTIMHYFIMHSLSCPTIMHYYDVVYHHALLSCNHFTIIHFYHALIHALLSCTHLSCSYYHALLSSTIMPYHTTIMSPLSCTTIMHYYHALLSCTTIMHLSCTTIMHYSSCTTIMRILSHALPSRPTSPCSTTSYYCPITS